MILNDFQQELTDLIDSARASGYDISPSLESEPVTNFRYKCSIDLYAPSRLVANKVLSYKRNFTISPDLFRHICIRARINIMDLAKSLYLRGFETEEETVYLYKLEPIKEWCDSNSATDFIKNIEVRREGQSLVRLDFISPNNYSFGGYISFESEYIGAKVISTKAEDLSEPVLTMKQYWLTKGVCDKHGKYAETSSLTLITEDSLKHFEEVLSKGGINAVKHLYRFGIHIGSLKEICFKDNGIIDLTCDNLDKFDDKLKISHTVCKNDSSLRLDFGTDYDGTFGGYIEFSHMTQSEINCFKEININTINNK